MYDGVSKKQRLIASFSVAIAMKKEINLVVIMIIPRLRDRIIDNRYQN